MDAVPNRDQAIVDPVKIADYLLSEIHPIGRGKARFFKRFGFREDAPEKLVRALLAHVQDCPVADIDVSPVRHQVSSGWPADFTGWPQSARLYRLDHPGRR